MAGVTSAQRLVVRGNNPAAVLVLKALVIEIDLLVRFRVVSAADMAPLRSLLVQSIAVL